MFLFPCTSGQCAPNPNSPRTSGTATAPHTRLDIRKLETDVQFFYSKGLAKSTLRTYQSGKDHYTKFCTEANINPLPVSEQHLCFFVSFLAKQGLKHQTIECYLSAIRHLQISNGLKDPFLGELMPKLDYVLRGIKKHQAEQSSDDRTRLPIPPTLLSKMRRPCERFGE